MCRVDTKRFELDFNDDKAATTLTTTKPLDDLNVGQSDEIETSNEDSVDASASESSEEISGDDVNVSEDNTHEGKEEQTDFSSDHESLN